MFRAVLLANHKRFESSEHSKRWRKTPCSSSIFLQFNIGLAIMRSHGFPIDFSRNMPVCMGDLLMKFVDWVAAGKALQMDAFAKVRNVCQMVSPELVDIKKPYPLLSNFKSVFLFIKSTVGS